MIITILFQMYGQWVIYFNITQTETYVPCNMSCCVIVRCFNVFLFSIQFWHSLAQTLSPCLISLLPRANFRLALFHLPKVHAFFVTDCIVFKVIFHKLCPQMRAADHWSHSICQSDHTPQSVSLLAVCWTDRQGHFPSQVYLAEPFSRQKSSTCMSRQMSCTMCVQTNVLHYVYPGNAQVCLNT